MSVPHANELHKTAQKAREDREYQAEFEKIVARMKSQADDGKESCEYMCQKLKLTKYQKMARTLVENCYQVELNTTVGRMTISWPEVSVKLTESPCPK